MWYKIDFTKLVMQLLPPVLRSRFLSSLLSVLMVPLRYIYIRFCNLKENADNRLNITGNVQYLEKALNDAFFLTDHQVYIDTPEEEDTPAFYFSSEIQSKNYLFMQSEDNPFIMIRKGESRVLMNMIVMVPTFLCTSLESKEADKYHWSYLTIIKNILKIYKPAGRTFSIELYDYE